MGAILGAYVLAIITIVIYMAYCARENRRRDRNDAGGAHRKTDFMDLTDQQNVHFRYVW
jgi:hypothetical protein